MGFYDCLMEGSKSPLSFPYCSEGHGDLVNILFTSMKWLHNITTLVIAVTSLLSKCP